MKKKLVGFLILFVMLFSLSAQSYKIETSRGTQTVEVPKGYTMEEAFIEMAKLYLEERFDHEDLIKETNALTISVRDYTERVEDLTNKNFTLLGNYKQLEVLHDDLIRLYEQVVKKTPFTPTLNLGYIYNIENNESMFIGSLGGTIFERVSLQTIFTYPFGVGISIGVQF